MTRRKARGARPVGSISDENGRRIKFTCHNHPIPRVIGRSTIGRRAGATMHYRASTIAKDCRLAWSATRH